jgi:hypothetical protein
MIYQHKHVLIEARQHEGAKIAVISNLKGNQTANAGDYLVTDNEATEPRGSIYVVPKADFERDYEGASGAAKGAAATTSNDPLLATARDALRSYQFGNSSPDLAKEVADKIMEHLKEDGPGPIPANNKPPANLPKSANPPKPANTTE